ncbi:hypothetical protein LSAT2_013259 [Lamellibrachia satsuma]|nr:hypothetical protein LSAT2_013259 [Lamellibrachia satsuma]
MQGRPVKYPLMLSEASPLLSLLSAGSTLDAMAKAVEDASVVLIAASHKYKESNNCNAEAQYAHTLRRTIIPLIVEPHYEPDGWLGMLVRPRLYFNFAKVEQFDSQMLDLLREIDRRLKVSQKKYFGSKAVGL